MKSRRSPLFVDVAILSLFTLLITLHPFYLYGELNCYELGIYLPGINAILDGQIPYRDFFHLRGPLELYIPAFFMRLWGENVAILASYFYLGTVITLILGIFIAKELYKTRLVLYLMVPVFIARTFPRVTFTFWGGMRYGFGLLAVLFAVYFLKQRRFRWLIFSGMTVALACLTSIEVGACAFASVPIALLVGWFVRIYDRRYVLKSLGIYFLGIILIAVPYFIYLLLTHSLLGYVESTWVVVTKMTKVFPDRLLEYYPGKFFEILKAMFPWSPYFKLLTPAYCYLFFIIYLTVKIRHRAVDLRDICISCVAAYGLIMYMTTFRKLMASQFEMALQPEKILLFFMLEKTFLFLQEKKRVYGALMSGDLLLRLRRVNFLKIYGIHFLVISFIMSSVGYSISRYNHRFFVFQYARDRILRKNTSHLIPLSKEKAESPDLKRLKGIKVPLGQVEDFKKLTQFIQEHTQPSEKVLMFPELGIYSFIVDRPFVGRFPMVTFSWMGNWHVEFMSDLKAAAPRFAVVAKDPGESFPRAHFKIPSNKQHYDDVIRYIQEHYEVVASTPNSLIYQRKGED